MRNLNIRVTEKEYLVFLKAKYMFPCKIRETWNRFFMRILAENKRLKREVKK